MTLGSPGFTQTTNGMTELVDLSWSIFDIIMYALHHRDLRLADSEDSFYRKWSRRDQPRNFLRQFPVLFYSLCINIQSMCAQGQYAGHHEKIIWRDDSRILRTRAYKKSAATRNIVISPEWLYASLQDSALLRSAHCSTSKVGGWRVLLVKGPAIFWQCFRETHGYVHHYGEHINGHVVGSWTFCGGRAER